MLIFDYINKIKDDKYIYFLYFKDSNNEDSEFDSHIYNGNKSFIESEELLLRNTFI
ncbi:hypothetical protein H8356DRAFT_1400805 [Neocallimastix lanati (nom. inval.)]|uniref:Uncharacterized protein n=1 Tax=Neocallimastix californiae TaxID=1754190 RepID=A0A1Y2ESW3_9FUNG|nr:hypothetical protein H8356DRAFT_1400805 [Neocallimastix sp. JGI-2020a]ORY74669.1 hypothetical protein LY90DRAFT_148494 [Neocallimastix californiae]|eukprot:ORY74669.1 hypothetical protein LY90DRAFT_148494 [Neocallimastix californiae]